MGGENHVKRDKMMKLTKELLANSFALSTAILWIFCSAFVWIFPGFSMTVSKWWMHGMQIENLGQFNLNISNFILGGITLVLSAWIIGYVFGWSLKYFSHD